MKFVFALTLLLASFIGVSNPAQACSPFTYSATGAPISNSQYGQCMANMMRLQQIERRQRQIQQDLDRQRQQVENPCGWSGCR